jgi:GNAT superfamily N-acetyltransferase
MRANVAIRRLGRNDARLFKETRLEMFRAQPRQFRYAPADESSIPLEQVIERIETNYVVAAFGDRDFFGMGGFSRFSGSKIDHKGLIWGMYVRPQMRGTGAADAIMQALLDHAARMVELVTLSVVAGNFRAVRFYERWGFRPFGTEPRSIKLGEDDYLDETMMFLPLSPPRGVERSAREAL